MIARIYAAEEMSWRKGLAQAEDEGLAYRDPNAAEQVGHTETRKTVLTAQAGTPDPALTRRHCGESGDALGPNDRGESW